MGHWLGSRGMLLHGVFFTLALLKCVHFENWLDIWLALHWLPIRHRCILKTALLVYKYLHTNCPKYFSPFLKVRQCAYNTRLSQSDGIILHVPQYQPSIYKSTKQFGLSFAYDAPKIWNELPDNVRSATSIASFRKKLKAYLFCQAYPP